MTNIIVGSKVTVSIKSGFMGRESEMRVGEVIDIIKQENIPDVYKVKTITGNGRASTVERGYFDLILIKKNKVSPKTKKLQDTNLKDSNKAKAKTYAVEKIEELCALSIENNSIEDFEKFFIERTDLSKEIGIDLGRIEGFCTALDVEIRFGDKIDQILEMMHESFNE